MKPDTVFIASVGRPEQAHLLKLQALGVSNFLPKPYDPEKLLKALRQALKVRPGDCSGIILSLRKHAAVVRPSLAGGASWRWNSPENIEILSFALVQLTTRHNKAEKKATAGKRPETCCNSRRHADLVPGTERCRGKLGCQQLHRQAGGISRIFSKLVQESASTVCSQIRPAVPEDLKCQNHCAL